MVINRTGYPDDKSYLPTNFDSDSFDLF